MSCIRRKLTEGLLCLEFRCCTSEGKGQLDVATDQSSCQGLTTARESERAGRAEEKPRAVAGRTTLDATRANMLDETM